MELNRAATFRIPKFLVVGHRGHGMNSLQSSDPRMKAIKENSILSFNSAAKFPIDFIEFDVQVINFSFFLLFFLWPSSSFNEPILLILEYMNETTLLCC